MKKERKRKINKNNYNNNDSKKIAQLQQMGGAWLEVGGANGHDGGDEEVCNITDQEEEEELKALQPTNQTGGSLVVQRPLVRRSNQLKGPDETKSVNGAKNSSRSN